MEQTNEQITKDVTWLAKKWWFRLLQVVFIISYALTIAVTVIFITTSFPHKYLDTSSSTVQCNNGNEKISSLNELGVYDISSPSDYQGDKFNVGPDDFRAWLLCGENLQSGLKINDINQIRTAAGAAPLSYTFHPVYSMTGNYPWWAVGSFVGVIGVWLLFKLLRIIFIYVAIGIKPQWKKELKKIY